MGTIGKVGMPSPARSYPRGYDCQCFIAEIIMPTTSAAKRIPMMNVKYGLMNDRKPVALVPIPDTKPEGRAKFSI